MRKILVAVALVVAAAAFLVVSGSGQVARADDSGAAVYKDFGCFLFDGNGGLAFVNVGTHSVEITNGNAVTICKASGVPNSTGRPVRWDSSNKNVGCFIAGALTTDWNETVSASGEATLRCHLNGAS